MEQLLHHIIMKVEVPQPLEEYVNGLVGGGGYSGSGEVIEEALREHQARRMRMEVVMTPELERLLDEGLENLERAQTTDELRHR
jgi:Arc/MetJ-type ribon-helix-helix transcriptional regulator